MQLSRALVLATIVALVAAACGDDTATSTETDASFADVGADSGSGDGADVGVPDTSMDAATDVPGEYLPGAGEYDHVVTLVDGEPLELINGVSSAQQVVLPRGAVSIAIVVEAEDASGDDVDLVVASWEDDLGTELVYRGWLGGASGPWFCLLCDQRMYADNGVFTAMAPNNQSITIEQSVHTFFVYGFTAASFRDDPVPWSGTARVSVYAKVLERGEPLAGTIDLNLWLSGAGDWTSANAAADEELQDILDDVAAVYAQVGIEIGQVTYNDIDPIWRIIETTEGSDSDLSRLFALSADAPLNAINLFFIDEVMQGAGDFSILLGIAGGIPGPVMRQGTPHSGVAIAVEQHRVGRFLIPMAPTIAHETGHYLGLFHTTEQYEDRETALHDPIDDTRDFNPDNLMYWSAEDTDLSREQGRVMRANLWVRHPDE